MSKPDLIPVPDSLTEAVVVDHAAQLVAQDRFSMTALARTLGVSRPALYRFAGSGDDVLKKVAAAGHDVPGMGPAKDRILAAADALFGTRGIENVTVDEIAAKAQVSPVTIYRIFSDREGLLRAFVAGISPRNEAMAFLEQADGPLDEVLRPVAVRMLVFIRRYRGLVGTSLAGEGAGMLDRLRGNQRTTRDALGRYFVAQMRAGHLPEQDPVPLVMGFVSLLTGAALLPPRTDDTEEEATWLVQLFLHGATQ